MDENKAQGRRLKTKGKKFKLQIPLSLAPCALSRQVNEPVLYYTATCYKGIK